MERLDVAVVAAPRRAPLLREISFAIERGRATGVLGRNGCGKSTLLRALIGLVPFEGSLTLDGGAVPPRAVRRMSGVTLQHAEAQLFGATVREDLALGGASDARVREIATSFGLLHLLDREPLTLSGGEQRLLALAGAVVTDPAIILWDEPLLELDWTATGRVVSAVREATSNGAAVVLTAHDYRDLLPIVDDWLVLDGGTVVFHGADLHRTNLSRWGVRPWG